METVMSNLTRFSFESHDLRIVDQHGQPWFVLKDLLASLGTSRTTYQSIESIEQGLGDGYTKDIPIPDRLGRLQNTTIIAEPAATFTLSRSNTDQGRRLNRFLHTEVLPALRKTGGYSINPAPVAPAPQPQPLPTKAIDLSRYAELLEAENALLRQQAQAAASVVRPVWPVAPPRPRPRPVTPEEAAQALDLFNTGASKYAIARALDRSTRTIGRILDRATAQAPVTGDLFTAEAPHA
jgi:prophage antirepressor-like protein